MIELNNVLELVKSTTKTKEKQEYIKDISDNTKKLFYLTYNPFITFGVKKIPEYTPIFDNGSEEDLNPFFDLCDKLSSRQLTGHSALDAISNTLSLYTEKTAVSLALVLGKDLKANLATEMINKIHKNLIPTFNCMLADKMDKRFDWNSGPWLVEYKYDGMRIIAQVTDDNVTYYSRSGIKQDKFQGLFDETLYELRCNYKGNIYIDGEVLASTFQATMQSRKENADKSSLVFRVFDLLTEKEWLAETTTRNQLDRNKELSNMMKKVISTNVLLTESRICTTKQELNNFYHKLVDEGAEGVIIKSLSQPYYWKRHRAWVKYKPIYTADLKIIGRYPGEKGTKFENTLGGFMLEGYLEDGLFVKANCGGGAGFSDEERTRFWNMDLDELLLKTAEVEYQEVSKSQDSEEYSLRFITFKQIREDK